MSSVHSLPPSLWKCKTKPTILRFYYTKHDGGDKKNESFQKQIKKAEKEVLKTVQKIIKGLKKRGEKYFKDPDFGPSSLDHPDDEFGAFSMYKSGKPGGPNYPKPEQSKWLRPMYHNPEEGDSSADDEMFSSSHTSEEVEYCTEGGGSLFKDGSGSGDVIQGKLGDCWFLSAIATLATRSELLRNVFWQQMAFAEYGIFVLKFMKDFTWHYVIIDDRIPCSNNCQPLFARCKDPDELWVPIIEKAYAKLNGSYDALIGGYIDYGLRDCTGLASHEIILQKGAKGYHNSIEAEIIGADDGISKCKLWDRLNLYHHNGSLLGTSIQPDPTEKGPSTVEHSLPNGLIQRHAYSILDLRDIEFDASVVVPGYENRKKFKLMRLRNPWGRGEWNGNWSDASDQMMNEQISAKVIEVFTKSDIHGSLGATQKYALSVDLHSSKVKMAKQKALTEEENQLVEVDDNDGSFFMLFEDWVKIYSLVFCSIDFPDNFCGRRLTKEWKESNAGGNNLKETWLLNPRHVFEVKKAETELFISLSQEDFRVIQGKDVANFIQPVCFHIVKTSFDADDVEKKKPKYLNEKGVFVADDKALMAGSKRDINPNYNNKKGFKQLEYNNYHTISGFIPLEQGFYTLVPSIYYIKKTGFYFLSIYGEENSFVFNDADADNVAEEEEEKTEVSQSEKMTNVEDEKIGDEEMQKSFEGETGDEKIPPDEKAGGTEIVKDNKGVDIKGSLTIDKKLTELKLNDGKSSAKKSGKSGTSVAGEMKAEESAEDKSKKFLFEYETTREKLLSIGKAKGIDFAAAVRSLSSQGDIKLTRKALKSKLIDFGYAISEVPDNIIDILARQGVPPSTTETIDTISSFISLKGLFEEEIRKEELVGKAKSPGEEEDDLDYAISDVSGLIHVEVIDAKDLKYATDESKQNINHSGDIQLPKRNYLNFDYKSDDSSLLSSAATEHLIKNLIKRLEGHRLIEKLDECVFPVKTVPPIDSKPGTVGEKAKESQNVEKVLEAIVPKEKIFNSSAKLEKIEKIGFKDVFLPEESNSPELIKKIKDIAMKKDEGYTKETRAKDLQKLFDERDKGIQNLIEIQKFIYDTLVEVSYENSNTISEEEIEYVSNYIYFDADNKVPFEIYSKNVKDGWLKYLKASVPCMLTFKEIRSILKYHESVKKFFERIVETKRDVHQHISNIKVKASNMASFKRKPTITGKDAFGKDFAKEETQEENKEEKKVEADNNLKVAESEMIENSLLTKLFPGDENKDPNIKSFKEKERLRIKRFQERKQKHIRTNPDIDSKCADCAIVLGTDVKDRKSCELPGEDDKENFKCGRNFCRSCYDKLLDPKLCHMCYKKHVTAIENKMEDEDDSSSHNGDEDGEDHDKAKDIEKVKDILTKYQDSFEQAKSALDIILGRVNVAIAFKPAKNAPESGEVIAARLKRKEVQRVGSVISNDKKGEDISFDEQTAQSAINKDTLIYSRVLQIAGEGHAQGAEALNASVNLQSWFRTFDADNSGTINASEFLNAMRELKFELESKQMYNLLLRFDNDGDFNIDYTEFSDLINLSGDHKYSIRELLEKVRRLKDADGSLEKVEGNPQFKRIGQNLNDFHKGLKSAGCEVTLSEASRISRVLGNIHNFFAVLEMEKNVFDKFMDKMHYGENGMEIKIIEEFNKLITSDKNKNEEKYSYPILWHRCLFGQSETDDHNSEIAEVVKKEGEKKDDEEEKVKKNEVKPAFVAPALNSNSINLPTFVSNVRQLISNKKKEFKKNEEMKKSEDDKKEEIKEAEMKKEDPKEEHQHLSEEEGDEILIRCILDNCSVRKDKISPFHVSKIINAKDSLALVGKLRNLILRQSRLRNDSEWYLVDVTIDASRSNLYVTVKDPEVMNGDSAFDSDRRLSIPVDNVKMLTSDTLNEFFFTSAGKFYTDKIREKDKDKDGKDIIVSKEKDIKDKKSHALKGFLYEEFKSKSATGGKMIVRGLTLGKIKPIFFGKDDNQIELKYKDGSAMEIEYYNILKSKAKVMDKDKHFKFSLLTSALSYSEDKAISNLLDRLIFQVNPKTKMPKLSLSESNDFVEQLRLKTKKLGNFVNVSSTMLSFREEIEEGHVANSVKLKILKALRDQPSFCSFLISADSTLYVTFEGVGTEDSNFFETMTWSEFVSHLKGLRNPFVGLKLSPSENEELSWKQTQVAVDGGRHPIWNARVDLDYRVPVDSSELISTDVIEIDHSYLVVSVKMKENKIFGVAYNPNTADEYILNRNALPWEVDFGKIFKDNNKKYANKAVALNAFKAEWEKVLDRLEGGESKKDIKEETQKKEPTFLWDLLQNSSNEPPFLLGDCLTPRLLVSVSCNGDFMGECDIPVSSIAKFGVETLGWFTLHKEVENDKVEECGRVRLRFTFDSLDVLEAQKQRKLLEATKIVKGSKNIGSTTDKKEATVEDGVEDLQKAVYEEVMATLLSNNKDFKLQKDVKDVKPKYDFFKNFAKITTLKVSEDSKMNEDAMNESELLPKILLSIAKLEKSRAGVEDKKGKTKTYNEEMVSAARGVQSALERGEDKNNLSKTLFAILETAFSNTTFVSDNDDFRWKMKTAMDLSNSYISKYADLLLKNSLLKDADTDLAAAKKKVSKSSLEILTKGKDTERRRISMLLYAFIEKAIVDVDYNDTTSIVKGKINSIKKEEFDVSMDKNKEKGKKGKGEELVEDKKDEKIEKKDMKDGKLEDKEKKDLEARLHEFEVKMKKMESELEEKKREMEEKDKKMKNLADELAEKEKKASEKDTKKSSIVQNIADAKKLDASISDIQMEKDREAIKKEKEALAAKEKEVEKRLADIAEKEKKLKEHEAKLANVKEVQHREPTEIEDVKKTVMKVHKNHKGDDEDKKMDNNKKEKEDGSDEEKKSSKKNKNKVEEEDHLVEVKKHKQREEEEREEEDGIEKRKDKKQIKKGGKERDYHEDKESEKFSKPDTGDESLNNHDEEEEIGNRSKKNKNVKKKNAQNEDVENEEGEEEDDDGERDNNNNRRNPSKMNNNNPKQAWEEGKEDRRIKDRGNSDRNVKNSKRDNDNSNREAKRVLLGDDWEERFTDTGRVYYADTINKVTQWEHPLIKPRQQVKPPSSGSGKKETKNNGRKNVLK